MPYISIPAESLYEDGSKSAPPVVMGDSTMITKTFIEKGLTKDFNAKLSGSQKLQDIGLIALLEDKLYWYNVCNHLFPILCLERVLPIVEWYLS